MDNDIQSFLAHLLEERGLSPNTIESYSRDLILFAKFLEQNDIEWQQVASHHVRKFVATRHRQGASGKSITKKSFGHTDVLSLRNSRTKS